VDTYPWIEPGDEITCDLLNGMKGLHGEVLDVALNDDDGSLRAISIRQQPDSPALHIRGDLLAIWRLGAPVTQVPNGLAVPQLSPGILRSGPNRG
jgi:hypothetical protein